MAFESRYSFLDRMLHRLAFATWPLQVAMADMENQTYKAELAAFTAGPPVFVSGLPRAGTTLLLEMIEATGAFASYQYKDMPFLLTPMMWAGAGASRTGSMEQERAHGDGMTISLDSPEAFEEVVWRTFWGDRYLKDRMKPWTAKREEEFETFFGLQMRKIIALRRRGTPDVFRYLSKNNGNIARLPAIRAMTPEALIVVPFREPLAQARSLLAQHQGFLAMHREDAFAREYMGAIGHYDFGANLKPIDFGGWMGETRPDFERLETWLRYWCAAHTALLAQTGGHLQFFSYDRMCERPAAELARLETWLGLSVPGALSGQADRIKAGPASAPAPAEIDAGLLNQARAVFDALCERAK